MTVERRILMGLYSVLMLACCAATLAALLLAVSWVIDAIAAGAVVLGLLAIVGSFLLIVMVLALLVFTIQSIFVAVRGEW